MFVLVNWSEKEGRQWRQLNSVKFRRAQTALLVDRLIGQTRGSDGETTEARKYQG